MKNIKQGSYTAKISHDNYVMIVADDGSQHGRVCNYPAARYYANPKTAERGAMKLLKLVAQFPLEGKYQSLAGRTTDSFTLEGKYQSLAEATTIRKVSEINIAFGDISCLHTYAYMV